MQRYEYKVVPAPEKGKKAKGVKTGAERFALALSEMMNELGAEGWEYVRADTLPSVERAGLTSSHTIYRNLLVFRRPLAAPGEAEAGAEPPRLLTADIAEETADETDGASTADAEDAAEPDEAPEAARQPAE